MLQALKMVCGILSVLAGGATVLLTCLPTTAPPDALFYSWLWCLDFPLELFTRPFPLSLSLENFSRSLCLISILALCSLLLCWNLEN